jgi:ribosomal protein S12 methylthiotransferase
VLELTALPKEKIMPKVGFISLGCPKNLVDSEVMMGILARSGYELTGRAGDADVLVVNTCSFIEAAQQESVDTILEMAEHKKFGRAQKLIVAGCLVERYHEKIRMEIPEVDAVIGTGEVEHILKAIEGDLRPNPPGLPAFLYHDASPRVLSTPRHAAYIKIAEGCDHPCSFCIIPQLRGNFRSRRFESVVREAENLAAAGVREITLIGQDTTSYGEDLGLRDGLAELLARLAQVEGVGWVRFLYAYPNRVTQRLLETLAEHPRLVKYMDMPLQHASRGVLAQMKRGSNGAAFLRLLERIRGTVPDVMLRTSFIVGFPGETEADFCELCDFVRAAEFDWMGVFGYSDVENAASHALGAKVDAETIAERRDRLMKLQRKISARRLRRFVGQSLPALVEGPSRDQEFLWEARLEGMAPEIDGKLYLTDIQPQLEGASACPGDMAKVEITKALDYDLVGRVVETEERLPRSAEPLPMHAARQISTATPLRILA